MKKTKPKSSIEHRRKIVEGLEKKNSVASFEELRESQLVDRNHRVVKQNADSSAG